MSIGNGAPAWPSVIVSNGRISGSEHIRPRGVSSSTPSMRSEITKPRRFIAPHQGTPCAFSPKYNPHRPLHPWPRRKRRRVRQ